MTNDPTCVRVRFAPSPTGMLHLGGARTAIYNWAFARSQGGTFILRIEDTDPERSTEENTQIILRAMRWLGLDWDEGPEVGGASGPYFQTERASTYAAALEELKAKGAAYPCFCTKERLDACRAEAECEQGGYAGYDGLCRSVSADEAAARISAGEPHVWRLRVPEGHGPIEFDDAVYGHMSFPADVMDDLILVRSDGSPTYNFAVVCDDANMGITHVIRGDDHLSNTPRQILIYEALGMEVPTFAHLPMILGPDGKKLSKRHGATNVEDYRDRGFVSDAMVNYLALLGWSLDGETTVISRDVLASEFSLDRISKKDAVFDEEKLAWLDGVYIREMDAGKWLDVAAPWLAYAHHLGDAAPAGASVASSASKDEQKARLEALIAPWEEVAPESWQGLLADVADRRAWHARIHPLIVERQTTFNELPDKLAYLFWGPRVVLDEKSVSKVLLKEGGRADEALRICREVLADESIPWEAEPLQEACRAKGEAAEIKPKLLFQPLRVAICGNQVSPPLFESIELMPREDVLARIDAVVAKVLS